VTSDRPPPATAPTAPKEEPARSVQAASNPDADKDRKSRGLQMLVAALMMMVMIGVFYLLLKG
jgi:hypothetical protein